MYGLYGDMCVQQVIEELRRVSGVHPVVHGLANLQLSQICISILASLEATYFTTNNAELGYRIVHLAI